MNFCAPTLAALPMPDISPYLTKGIGTNEGLILQPGTSQTWLLLGGGVLLLVAGLVLIMVMYSRVKFFALEFGKGRFTTMFPYLAIGSLLMVVGGLGGWLGWQALGYSVKLEPAGLTERWRGGMTLYTWENVESASERLKATEFWINFAKEGKSCRVRFQQRYIGEKLQDRAIQLAEAGLINGKAQRIAE